MPNNTFFQQPIRRRIGRSSMGLDEQLLRSEHTEFHSEQVVGMPAGDLYRKSA